MGLTTLLPLLSLIATLRGQALDLTSNVRPDPVMSQLLLTPIIRRSGSNRTQKGPREAGLFWAASDSITWLGKPCNQQRP